jgi:lipoyl(octanoyl) transferase
MKTRVLGRCDYLETFEAMRRFTAERDVATVDELWLCEHDPVFTQGVAGRPEHVLDAGSIPLVQSNRGGQVTYHGPGQVVAYPLVDLKRLGLHVKTYVHRLEEAVIRFLGAHGGHSRLDGPTDDDAAPCFDGLAKIAALGIKVSRHHAYHGLALNIAMDLEPFSRILPCGWKGLATIDLDTLDVKLGWDEAAAGLAERLERQLAQPENA